MCDFVGAFGIVENLGNEGTWFWIIWSMGGCWRSVQRWGWELTCVVHTWELAVIIVHMSKYRVPGLWSPDSDISMAWEANTFMSPHAILWALQCGGCWHCFLSNRLILWNVASGGRLDISGWYPNGVRSGLWESTSKPSSLCDKRCGPCHVPVSGSFQCTRDKGVREGKESQCLYVGLSPLLSNVRKLSVNRTCVSVRLGSRHIGMSFCFYNVSFNVWFILSIIPFPCVLNGMQLCGRYPMMLRTAGSWKRYRKAHYQFLWPKELPSLT